MNNAALGETVERVTRALQAAAPGGYPDIKRVCLAVEEEMGGVELTDIHAAMLAAQAAGHCVLYQIDDPQRLATLRMGSFTLHLLPGVERHLIRYH